MSLLRPPTSRDPRNDRGQIASLAMGMTGVQGSSRHIIRVFS